MPGPIGFTCEQMAQVHAIASQIPRPLRDDFLRRVAASLAGSDFGDGDVYRACVDASRELLRPAAKAG